jgi:hypothetical protein
MHLAIGLFTSPHGGHDQMHTKANKSTCTNTYQTEWARTQRSKTPPRRRSLRTLTTIKGSRGSMTSTLVNTPTNRRPGAGVYINRDEGRSA